MEDRSKRRVGASAERGRGEATTATAAGGRGEATCAVGDGLDNGKEPAVRQTERIEAQGAHCAQVEEIPKMEGQAGEVDNHNQAVDAGRRCEAAATASRHNERDAR